MHVSDNAYLIKNTSIVSVCRGAGVLTGMLLDAIILASFGIGHETDAFFVALAIPILIDGTLGIQLTQVLIPQLASLEKESIPEGRWRFFSNLITIWLLVASLVAAVATAIAFFIIPLQAPGLAPSATKIAINMSMLLVWLVPLSGVVAMLQGALFSFHQFWLTSSTKAISNICIVASLLALRGVIGIYGLAIGYLFGFAVQCIVLWTALRRRGFVYRWTCDFRSPRVRDTTKLVFYPLAAQMLGECRTLVENFFASFYAPGVLSALRYASRIAYSVSGVLMSSVVTASTPMVAQYVADKNFDGMKRALRSGVQVLMFISVPVCAWLAFTGESLITLLFERGQFSKADVVLTSSLMALMTPYIFFSRAISITQTPFYAIKDTRTLAVGMILSFVFYLAIARPLLFWLGVYGFPLATSLSTALGALYMCVILHRSFGSIGWSKLRSFGARIICVGIATVVALVMIQRFGVPRSDGTLLSKFVAVIIPSLFGAVVFFGTALGLRVINVGDMAERLNLVRRKLSF